MHKCHTVIRVVKCFYSEFCHIGMLFTAVLAPAAVPAVMCPAVGSIPAILSCFLLNIELDISVSVRHYCIDDCSACDSKRCIVMVFTTDNAEVCFVLNIDCSVVVEVYVEVRKLHSYLDVLCRCILYIDNRVAKVSCNGCASCVIWVAITVCIVSDSCIKGCELSCVVIVGVALRLEVTSCIVVKSHLTVNNSVCPSCVNIECKLSCRQCVCCCILAVERINIKCVCRILVARVSIIKHLCYTAA